MSPTADTIDEQLGRIYVLTPPPPAKQRPRYVGKTDKSAQIATRMRVGWAKHGKEGDLYDWLGSLGDDKPVLTVMDTVPTKQLAAYHRAWVHELLGRGAPLLEDRDLPKPHYAIREKVHEILESYRRDAA